ncbi:hypothetical protein ATANTOWER_015939 [Ataeniobius toweri]|uniref:Uncharacterized protein n=1 Tax=Ataeniobius toweri TaxID=208326 RepID=A0ABU7AI36_9TELE|nr:hypothetical protein [Ataeniobius toweri]
MVHMDYKYSMPSLGRGTDPASLIPLAVQLPPPLVIYRSRISNPYHSHENKTFKLSIYLLSVILHVGQIINKL